MLLAFVVCVAPGDMLEGLPPGFAARLGLGGKGGGDPFDVANGITIGEGGEQISLLLLEKGMNPVAVKIKVSADDQWTVRRQLDLM